MIEFELGMKALTAGVAVALGVLFHGVLMQKTAAAAASPRDKRRPPSAHVSGLPSEIPLHYNTEGAFPPHMNDMDQLSTPPVATPQDAAPPPAAAPAASRVATRSRARAPAPAGAGGSQPKVDELDEMFSNAAGTGKAKN